MWTYKIVVGLSGLLLALAAGSAAVAPTPREILGSELLVKEYLDKLDVPHGRIHPVRDELLARALPSYLFFVVIYPEAAAVNLPEPLRPVNVFAVDPSGLVRLLVSPDDLLVLFKTGFDPGKTEERCKDAVRIALLLLKVRYPEFRFAATETITITPEGKEIKRGIGKLAVQEGTGALEVILTLDKNCHPVKIIEHSTAKRIEIVLAAPTAAEITTAEVAVKTYVRTLKLSVDPVKYIDDPVLRRVFAGRLFFVVPVLDPDSDTEKETGLNLMVVGTDGKPQPVISRHGEFMRWFNAAFGPVTTDPRLKEAATIALRFRMATNPNFKFAQALDPLITAEDGNKVIMSKYVGTNRAGKNVILRVKLVFGKRGKLIGSAWWINPEKG